MAEQTKVEGVYEIRIVQGPALKAFEEIKKRLDDTKGAIKDMNKATRTLVAEEQAINKAIAQTGQATDEQNAALAANRKQREALNKTLAEAVLIDRGLSGQARELSNNLSGLTENGLRFRDKMAEATTIALQQSGIIDKLADRHKELSGAMAKVDDALQTNEAQVEGLNAAMAKAEITEEKYREEQERLASELIDARAAQKLLGEEMVKNNTITAQLDTKVGELNKQLADGKITTKQYGESLKAVEDQTRKSMEATAALSSKFDEFVSKQGKELRSTMTSIVGQYIGVQAVINGVVNVIGHAATTISEFSVQLKKVSALGGEYADRINELGDAAKSLGPKFGVGPKKALESVEALAKAGVSASDILGGALEGALTLSASGALAAGDAAEYAASTMVQFGLSGKDMTHVADLLSGAANKAMGEVSDFGDALKFIGPVAAGAGISLEETTGTLALFAQNGILGQMAGTGLRGVLASLTSPSAQASKQLEQLGVITADGTNKLYDSQGAFKGLANLAGVLQEATAGLTQQQKDQALGQIFGNQQITAANILLKGGKDAVNEWTDAVNDSGISQRIASEQLNTVSGSVDRLSASWDAAVVSIDKGDGPISNAIKNMLDGFTSIINYAIDARGEVGRLLSADLDARKARGELTNDEYEAQQNVIKAVTETGRAQDQLNDALKERNLHSSDYSDLLAKNNDQLLKSIGYSKTQEETEAGLQYVRETLNDEIEAAAPLMAKAADATQSLTYEQKIEVEARKAGIEILQQEVDRREKAISVTKEQAAAQQQAAAAAKAEKDGKATSATATLGERTAYLKEQLEAAKAARENLTATDTAGIKVADKNIASIQRQIDALQGNAKATKVVNDAAKERKKILEDITKAEQDRANANDTPQQKEVAGATTTRDDRVEKAKGNAGLLLKIEEEYQSEVTNIQVRYAAERFAARQQAEDNAAAFVQGERDKAASVELQELQKKQSKELALAIVNGEDYVGLMRKQSEQRIALTQELRDAQERSINETYEAQYAAADAAGASTVELQRAHGEALAALRGEFRQQDEESEQEYWDRISAIKQANTERDIQSAQEVLNGAKALGDGIMAIEQARTDNKVAQIDQRIALAKQEGKDTTALEAEKNAIQKEAARKAYNTNRAFALAQLAVDSARAIASLVASSTANPLNSVTFGAAGIAQFAAGMLAVGANMAQAIALLSKKAPGFAGGGEVPEGRGTVTHSWGARTRRPNGDDRLVTLKTGEKVLNEDQQERLERIAGRGVWGDIGLPGHSMTDTMRLFRRGNSIAGYAEGGTVGIVTPRPSSQTIVQNQFVQAMGQVADRPMFVNVREINDVQSRVNVTENLGTL